MKFTIHNSQFTNFIKVIGTILLLLAAVLISHAQEKPLPSGYIAFSSGSAIPVGAYKTDGYAMSGTVLNISGGWAIHHTNFGIGYRFDYITNDYDVQTNLNDLVLDRYTSATLTAAPYQVFTTMAGGFVTLPVNRFSFDLHVLGGTAFATNPPLKLSTSTYYNKYNHFTVTGTYPAATAAAPAFDGGIGIRCLVTKHICVMVTTDYFYTEPMFMVKGEIVDSNSGTQKDTQNFTRSFSIINVTGGVGWQF